MRTGFLFPLAALVVVGSLGCSRGDAEESASVVNRDLTRVGPVPNIELASPLEVATTPPVSRAVKPRATSRTVRARHRSTIDLKPSRAALAIHTPVAVSTPEPQPAAISEPPSDRELPPGKTVTLIPSSSGPSTTIDPEVDEGLRMIQRGHYCPPPRPGVGVRRPPALY